MAGGLCGYPVFEALLINNYKIATFKNTVIGQTEFVLTP